MNDLAVTGLRQAGPADLDLIASLETACFEGSDGAFNRRQLRALLMNPNAYWLLSLDGRGMACWLKASNGRARWARLYSLAVHPRSRGRGLARQLLEAGFNWMRNEKLGTCRAEVRAINHAARQLYARYGFREDGGLRDYYAPGEHGIRLTLGETGRP